MKIFQTTELVERIIWISMEFPSESFGVVNKFQAFVQTKVLVLANQITWKGWQELNKADAQPFRLETKPNTQSPGGEFSEIVN